jgi:plastocyanin
MTLKFHQTWTGEPHTVTAGTAVQDLVEPELLPIIRKSLVESPDDSDDLGPAVDAAAEEFFGKLPFFFGEKGITQAVGQPCVVKSGLPKGDGPCAKRALPAFTGTDSYYNSGFIPYLGSRGNEFEMKIAENAKPGTYFYYCALHGPTMDGEITITKSGRVSSQAELNRQARKEVDAVAKPLLTQLNKERSGNSEFKGNLAGSGSEATAKVNGQVNEFTPRTVKAEVGKPVSWTFIGSHTISFNVPPYVPYYSVKKSGTVVQSESIYAPAGGWPGRTPSTEEDGPSGPAQKLPAVNIDAGKFDGSGKLRSSGVDWQTGDTYSVTFTKAGTYPMACLVHPGMVGKVVVS